MLETDFEEAGASGADNGGSSGRGGTGTGADGGSAAIGGGGSSSKGGSPGYGGTGGTGGTGGSYGGTPGKGGGPGRGGTYGKGGSAGYPMMTGGAYPTAGTGGAYPTAGRPGYGGSAGRGGYGGTSYGGRVGRGGSAGQGGQAGGGYGGSPSVVAACDAACRSLPTSCSGSVGYSECVSGCVPLSAENPQCSLELADYLNCLAGNLSPDAMCMMDPSGACYGNGCLDSAQTACTYWLSAYSDCTIGCGTGEGVGPDFCSYELSCANHNHQTQCKVADATSDLWYCTCLIDSQYEFEDYFQGFGTNSCRQVANYCNVAR